MEDMSYAWFESLPESNNGEVAGIMSYGQGFEGVYRIWAMSKIDCLGRQWMIWPCRLVKSNGPGMSVKIAWGARRNTGKNQAWQPEAEELKVKEVS